MALLKKINTLDNTGVYAEYWRVTSIDLDYNKKSATIFIDGYYNQNARVDGKNPLLNREYVVNQYDFISYFSADVLNQVNVNTVSQSYLFVKSLSGSEFVDALDI